MEARHIILDRLPPNVRCADRVLVAIDFETANTEKTSACAVGLIRVEKGKVVERAHRFIQPPSSHFEFTHIHGITWAQVRREPTFAEVWRELTPMLEGAHHFVAHNAAFDRDVLHSSCELYNVPIPDLSFICTLKYSRRTFTLPNYRLPTVSQSLDIHLDHHRADSDAEAAVLILLRSER